MKKLNKIYRHSGGRHPGSYHSDSAPAPGGDSYPESPAAKPQTDYFTDVAHDIKAGDSGLRGAAHLRRRAPMRYAMQMSGPRPRWMTAK